MAMIELVDFNEVYKTEEKAKKKSRRRGGKSKSTAPAAATAEAVVEEEKVEAPVVEEKVDQVETAPPEKSAEAPKNEGEESENKDGE
jgi:hypothetical protein